MSFTTEWDGLLGWEVQVVNPTGQDGFGNRTWTAPVTVPAHVDNTSVSERARGDREATAGTDTVQSGVIYLGLETITPVPGTRITFPYGLTVGVTTVQINYDDEGNAHHVECRWEAES